MADLGYFGPDSVSWQVHREVTVLFGGARAVLMQAAHPLVIAGARETGFYERNPWKRLQRTLVLTYTITFGSKAEADAAAERINDVHTRVKGIDAETGLPYDGLDPDLLLYVHACLIESALVFERLTVGELDAGGRQRFHEEQMLAAEMVGIPTRGDPAHGSRAPGVPAGRVRLGRCPGSARPPNGWPRCSTIRRARPNGGRCWSACPSWRSARCRGSSAACTGSRSGPAAGRRCARRSPRSERSAAPAAALPVHRAVQGVAHRELGARARRAAFGGRARRRGSQPARRDAERAPLDSARGRDRGRPARHRRRPRRVVGAAAGRDRRPSAGCVRTACRSGSSRTRRPRRAPTSRPRFVTRGSTSDDDEIITAVAADGAVPAGAPPERAVLRALATATRARTWRASSWSDVDDADVIVLGGASEDFTYPTMNRIFRRLMDGASLVGMHRNLYWRTSDGLELDAGAYIAGLEEATGREAVICGKPAAPYFDAALEMLGVPRERTIMVGDDIVNDVRGAQLLGHPGVLVRTGKFLPDDLAKVPEPPDDVLETIAGLAGPARPLPLTWASR